MEDLIDYLKEIVDPTIAELEAQPTSRRLTFLACVSVFHAIDHLAQPRNSRTLRQRFRTKSPAFKLVDEVAHAFKHFTTGGPTPLTVKDVISRPPAVWGEMVFDLSRWDDEAGGVTLDADRNVDLLAVIKEAVAFLRGQIP